MAASGGGLSSPANVAGISSQPPARGRFPGRPWTARSRLRREKRPQRGRLGSDGGELVVGGPRPVNIGLALSEDPSLLRLLGVTEKHGRQKDAGFYSSDSDEVNKLALTCQTASKQCTNWGIFTQLVRKRRHFKGSTFSQKALGLQLACNNFLKIGFVASRVCSA